MKNNIKKFIALFSATLFLFLSACSDKPINETDIKNQTVKVDVDDFTAEFVFNENGLIEKEKKFYNNLEKAYEYYECYEYNENSQITKRYATDLEGNVLDNHDVFEITYNENGSIKMISENKINYVFEYDTNGNPVKYTTLKNSVILNTFSFEYDTNGNKTKKTMENKQREYSETTDYTYNGSGLLVSEVTSTDGITSNNISYEYNENGLLAKSTSVKPQDTRTTVYEYKDGIAVKETMTITYPDNSIETDEKIYVTTYEYLGGGNVVKFSRERDGEIYITDAYSVDEAKGNYADIDEFVSL